MVRVGTEIQRLGDAFKAAVDTFYKDALTAQVVIDVATMITNNFHFSKLAILSRELGGKILAIPLIGCPKDYAVAVSDLGAALIEYSLLRHMSKAIDEEWARKIHQLEYRLHQIMAPSMAEFGLPTGSKTEDNKLTASSEPERNSLLSNIYRCMFIKG